MNHVRLLFKRALRAASLAAAAWCCAGPLQAQPVPSATAIPASVQHVFDQLVKAIGDPASPPRLEIVSGDRVTVAGYYPGERVVRVDRDFIALCGTFGADSLNALAAVLGHELAHCFRGFRAARDFGNDVYINWEHSVTREQIVNEETEADMFSGFYCHVAGYDAISITPALLEKVYERFKLPGQLPGYLSKDDRKAIAVRDGDRLRRLATMFDMGIFLTLAREYPEAQRCYDQVITQFPSRELLNNAGVAYAQQALQIMDGEDIDYIYPLELDADTRLRGIDVSGGHVERGTRSPSAADRVLIARLLDSATRRFRSARERDPAYAPALINLATIYILRHEFQKAMDTAGLALNLDTSRATRILALTVQSIAQSRLGMAAIAKNNLIGLVKAEGAADDADIARANLAVMEKTAFSLPGGIGTPSAGETICGMRATESATMMPPDIADTVAGAIPLRIMMKRLSACVMMRAQKDSSYAEFVITQPWNTEASRLGIRMGSTIDDVMHKYGPRPRVVNARQGRYLIYEYSKLMFLIDPDGKVIERVVYAVR